MWIEEATFEVPFIKPINFNLFIKTFLCWLYHQAQGSMQKQNIIKTYRA